MKYVIIIPDGCADDRLESLGDRTPLEAASTPNMDRIAAQGVVGQALFVPPELPPGSDVANLGLIGYNPNEYYSGRAPLEAAAQGIELGPLDWAVRCNMVTLEEGRMRSFAAGHISTEEAGQLLASLQEELSDEGMEFRTSVGYRNLLIWRGDESNPVPLAPTTSGVPPHDLADQKIADGHPRGPGSDVLCRLMDLSRIVFKDHPVNQKRIAAGKLPATNVWLWGMGRRPVFPSYKELRGLSGAMITGVDLLRGIARLIGWQNIDVPGATGYFDTDFAAKGRYAIEALDQFDVVCVHVEAPDEAGHDGNTEEKVRSLESIDRDIVGPLHEELERRGEYRLFISPDHPTPVGIKTHTRELVPWTAAGQGIAPDASTSYDERAAEQSVQRDPSQKILEGWRLMDKIIGG
jgi:2,3-bisphosphoglycerate-independent phosphoglycerate mutase